MTKNEEILSELQIIEKHNNGLVSPKAVVDWAQENTNSAIHSHFEWDDTKASIAYRLHQARMLINTVYVEMMVKDEPVVTRAYVSLTTERGDEGGYRAIVNVMSDDELRAILLKDALTEMGTFRRKYGHLKELSEVFKAVDKIQI